MTARERTNTGAIPVPGARPGNLDRRHWAAAGIALATVGAVGLMDLGNPLPLYYEVFLRWSAQRLAAGYGFHLWPSIAFWALPQIALGALTAVVHLDPRVMRLTVLPFLVAAGWGEYSLARQLGADLWWAAVAGLLLVCSPLTLALATGFSSDIPYLGLFVLAAAAGLRWVREGKSAVACIVLVLLAFAQRQYGAGVIAAVAGGLILARNQRHVVRLEWVWLVLGSGLVLAVGAGIYVSGLATPDSSRYLHDLVRPSTASIVWGAAELPVMIAFVALPLLLPLGLSRPRMPTYTQLWAPGLAVLSLIGCGLLLGGVLGRGRAQSIFPGEWFVQSGIGPAHLPGAKPALFSGTVFLCIEVATIAVVLLALLWRADLWQRSAGTAVAGYLGLLALSQLPAIYMDALIDRHFLPEAAVALPVLAGALSMSSFRCQWLMRRVHVVVLALAAIEVAVFAIGEQDFQSWTRAVGRAAKVELAIAPRSEIDAGPLNPLLVDIPFYERTGHLPRYPRPVRLYLAFAAPGDPEFGFDYQSLAPGRIVIRCIGASPAPGTGPKVGSYNEAVDSLSKCR